MYSKLRGNEWSELKRIIDDVDEIFNEGIENQEKIFLKLEKIMFLLSIYRWNQ